MTLNVLLTDVIITLNMNYITNLVCFLKYGWCVLRRINRFSQLSLWL